jgi:hypothetical protein
VALARQMPPAESADLYRRLRSLRLTWLERMAAQAAGVDVEAQRRRFLRILEEATAPLPTPAAPLSTQAFPGAPV